MSLALQDNTKTARICSCISGLSMIRVAKQGV